MRRAVIIVSIILASVPFRVAAFTADLLISDRDFTDAAALSLADVQRFLQETSSPLAYRFLPDSDGGLKLPAEVLWFAAQEAQISPKVLLATLQKEQRLVTDPKPSARAVDFAMGYGCPDGSGCSDRFRGFGKQVRGAALQFRGYLDDLATKGETIARWAVGRAKQTGDGFAIVPRNAATAALYSYTPWRGGNVDQGHRRVGGNLSFVRIFRQWFGGGAWPDGTVLTAPDGARWLLQGGKRRKFSTPAAYAARSGATPVPVTQEELETYVADAPIRFPEYAVVEGPNRVRWLLVGEMKRKIASREVFRQLGFHPEEVEAASAEDLAAYRDGAPIAKVTQDPRGVLVRERETKRLLAVIDGVKHPIDSAVAELRYPGERPIDRTAKRLKAFKTGKPLTLPDGILTTSRKYLPQVFFISRGERRPFASPRAFELLGYTWTDVRHVSDVALDLHPLGAVIGDEALEEAAFTATPAASRPAPPPAPKPYVSGLSVY